MPPQGVAEPVDEPQADVSQDPVVGELWECRKTHRAVVVVSVAMGWVHVQPVGLGGSFSMFPGAFLRDWRRADNRYQPEHLMSSPETGV